MSSAGSVTFGVLEDGQVVFRMTGHCTRELSPAFSKAACGSLGARPGMRLFIDLSPCEYLDSTFLGCILAVHRRAISSECEVFVSGDDEVLERLLRPTRLDTILKSGNPQAWPSDWTAVEGIVADEHAFGWHVAECHRALSSTGSSLSEAHREVADQLERELDERD